MCSSFWNNCIGNVDIVCKILKKRKTVRGPYSGSGSLMWFELFGYTLYNGFRLFKHGELDQTIDRFKSFQKFQTTRKKRTFISFLLKLVEGDCFDKKKQ